MRIARTLKDIFRNNFREFSASFLLAGTVFLFSPLYIMLVNKEIVPVTFLDVWPLILFSTCSAFLALEAIILIFRKASKTMAAIYIGLTIAFIVQGNFPLYSLGKLDGQVIQWSDYSKYLPLDLLIWTGSIALCLYFRKSIYKNPLFTVAFLLIANIVPILALISSTDLSVFTSRADYFNKQNEFEFSNEKNVVVIILDTFRADAFAEIIQSDPHIAEAFRDFTFFSNTAAGYPTTEPSIPLILTGAYYENSETFDEYIEAYENKSLPNFLNNNGVTAEAYFFTATFFNKWHNFTLSKPIEYLTTQFYKELIITFIRYLPLPLKKYFIQQYYAGTDYYHKNMLEFYDNAKKITVKNKPTVFKFIHLSGAHPPYYFDAEFQQIDKGYLEQAKASLKAVARLLEHMRMVEVYDNSTIIISGDHGADNSLTFKYIPSISMQDENAIVLTNGMISQANPLLIAKGFHQNNSAITESSVPVSLMDIPATVANTLGLHHSFPGYSIFQDIPNERIRKYYHYKWSDLDWNNPYLPAMYPFEIQGKVVDPDAWKFLFKVHKEEIVEEVYFPDYQYGTNLIHSIFTTETGNLFSPGFWITQNSKEGEWAKGPVSCTNLRVKPSDRYLALSIKGIPFLVTGLLEKQAMEIRIDQEQIASFNSIANTNIVIQPNSTVAFTNDGEIQICFGFPDSRSQMELGVNEDSIQLAYFFSEISLSEISGLSFPVEIPLTRSSISIPPQLQIVGLSDAEPEFSWTNGKEVSIKFPIIKNDKNIVLEFSATPFIVPGSVDNQQVIVRANGREIQELVIDQYGEYSVTIPAQYISDMIDLQILLPIATSPLQLGINQDKRELSLALQWIRFREE